MRHCGQIVLRLDLPSATRPRRGDVDGKVRADGENFRGHVPNGYNIGVLHTKSVRCILLALGAAIASASLAAAAGPPVSVVQAPDSPVKLDQVKVLNTDATPLVLLYAATNLTDTALDQFTVTVFVFDRDKRLKARQVAPGRRTLDARGTKFSAMILDVGGIDPADSLMVGVDQAQQVGSEQWWRSDLRTLAEAAAKPSAR
jgi:hypothetical protein